MPRNERGPGALAGATEARERIALPQRVSDSTGARPAPEAAQRDLRFRRDVQRLHALGPRAIYEMLAELGARRLLRTELEELVGLYAARLGPQVVRATGADRLPPLPSPRLVRP